MKNQLIFGLFACFILGLVGLLSSPVAAQGLTSVLGATTTPAADSEIAKIMRSASENGVSVVVIDSDGTIITQIGDNPPADTIRAESSSMMSMQESAGAFRAALVERLLGLPNALNEVLYILRATSPDGTIFAYAKVLFFSMLMLGAGMVFAQEIYGKRIIKRFVMARIIEKPQGYAEKMPFLMFRFFMGVIGILVAIVVAYILGTIIFGSLEDPALQFTAVLINVGFFLIRLVISVWRMILSPFLSQYRIPLLSDQDAKRLFNWMSMGTFLGLGAILFGIWIQELGLNAEVYVFLYSLLSFLVMVQSVALVLFNHRAVSNALLNGTPLESTTLVLRALSRAWAPISILFFVFAWSNQTFQLIIGEPETVPLLVGGWVILTTIIVVYGVLNFFIERNFARSRRIVAQAALTGTETAVPVATLIPRSKGLTNFEELAQRIAGIIAFVAGLYAFVVMWSGNAGIMANSIADRSFDIVVILFLGYIGYNAFRIWVDKKIVEEQGDIEAGELGDEGGGTSASRLATLLPLFRNFILIVIVATVFLIGLMELGVNVGPLFAGAGIVGVAVGFGSQSLVRDIFSGAFFLFDDSFRRGEYIDVGGVKGTVEKISVRSFQLRHHLGALHTMPFGEIQVLTNYSRDWVIMKLPMRVTYDTDVEKVRKLIKKLGVQLLDDPVIGENFIQPLKSQGVIEMQDSAMIIRVKFMTKPGDQWLVRKKVYEEIRALFEREGIKFAHREVTVRLADGKKAEDLDEDDRKAVTAAAQASIEEDLMEGGAADGDDR